MAAAAMPVLIDNAITEVETEAAATSPATVAAAGKMKGNAMQRPIPRIPRPISRPESQNFVLELEGDMN